MINLQFFFKYPFILLVIVMLNFSCRPHRDPDPCFETYNDFENSIGWVESLTNNSQTVSKDAGYESEYGCKVNRITPFGYIFKLNFLSICPEKTSILKVKFMCKNNLLRSDSCNLVFSVTDTTGKVITWKEILLKNDLKANEWVEIEKEFKIGEYYSPTNVVSILSWNHNSTQEIFLDNIQLKFY